MQKLPKYVGDVLNSFDNIRAVTPREGWKGQWRTLCPNHDDHRPSLSIGLREDGIIFMNCFGGCRTDDILEAVGLETKNLFPHGIWSAYQFPLDQNGDALKFAVKYKDTFRYVIPWVKNNWLTYDGIRWNRDLREAEASECARHILRELYKEAAECKDDEERKLIGKWAAQANKYCSSSVSAILRLARFDRLIRIEKPATLNSQEYLLNCPNGTVDLRTGILLPHNPTDLITLVTATSYPAETGHEPSWMEIKKNAALWLKCLQEWMEQNKDLIRYLQNIFGYSLTSHIMEKLFFLFIGKSNTGKSTCLDTFTALLGDYAGVVPRTLFKQERFDRHPAEMAVIEHKRFMTVSDPETEERMTLKTSLAKSLSGDHFLQVRGMGENFYTIRPECKFVISCNEEPRIKDPGDAIWNRLRKIAWGYVIPKREQNRNLFEDLKAEWPWILAWAAQGSKSWYKTEEIITPQEVIEDTEEYRKKENPVAEFINECCERAKGVFITNEKLWDRYNFWIQDNRKYDEKLSPVNFGHCLGRLGYVSDRRRVEGKFHRGWLNLKV